MVPGRMSYLTEGLLCSLFRGCLDEGHFVPVIESEIIFLAVDEGCDVCWHVNQCPDVGVVCDLVARGAGGDLVVDGRSVPRNADVLHFWLCYFLVVCITSRRRSPLPGGSMATIPACKLLRLLRLGRRSSR